MADHDKQTVRRWIAVGATVVALVPILLMVITRAGRAYLPTQDFAVIDLRVRDVWNGDLPLVGVYSRFGWNHPGPLLLWALAPLNALFGGAPWTTLVGHSLLQVVAVVVAAWLAWKRGGLSLVLGVLAVLLLTYIAIGDFLLFQPWNPHVAVVFFPAFVLAIWGVALGDRRDLVVSVLVGTFLVQAHVGYVPLVVATALVAGVFVVLDRRRVAAADRPSWRTPILVSVGVSVLLWLPVVYEQLTESPGNLRRMGSYFFDNKEPATGLWDGLGLLAAQYRYRPPWLGGPDLGDPFTLSALPAARAWLLIPLGLLVWAGIMSVRRADRAAFRIVVLIAVLNGVGILTLARVTGTAYPYLIYWRIPLATFTLLVAAWTLARAYRLASVPVARALGYAVLIGFVVVPTVQFTREVADHPGLVAPIESTVKAMLPKLERAADGKTVVVRVADSATRGLQGGLFDALDRAGVDVRVDTGGGYQFGPHREIDAKDADSVWYVIEESGLTSVLSAEPGARVLAKSTPLSATEDAELTRLQRELATSLRQMGQPDVVSYLGDPFLSSRLAGIGGLDPDVVRRTTALNLKVARSGECRCAVVAFAPDAVPSFAISISP